MEPNGRQESGRAPSKPLRRRRSTVTHIAVQKRVVLTINDEKLTIGELTDRIGFGWYQIQVFSMAFGVMMVESAQILMVSSLVTPICEEFHVQSTVGRAGFAAVLFMGIQVGTVVAGLLADTVGRRWPITMGYAGMMAFGVASAFARGPRAMYTLLFFVGFSSGLPIPCAIVALSEVMPSTLRGASGAALGVSFRVGFLWSAVGLRVWMPRLTAGPWRWLLAWAAAPASVFLLLSWLSPPARQETPHFLAIAGRGRALISTMNLMAETNGRADLRMLQSDDLKLDRAANTVTCREVTSMMCTSPLRHYFIIMTLLFFCKEFVSGGISAYWPVTLSQLQGHHPDNMEVTAGLKDPQYIVFAQLCEILGVDTTMTASMGLIVTGLVGLPGIPAAMVVMHWLSRHVAFAVGTCITGTGGLLLLSLYSQHRLWGVLGVGLIQLFFPTWQMITMLLGSEIFPTQVRGIAYSISFFLGRFGSEVAQFVVHAGHAPFPVATAALAASALVLVQALPKTKGVELTNFCSEASPTRSKSGSKSQTCYGTVERGTEKGLRDL